MRNNAEKFRSRRCLFVGLLRYAALGFLCAAAGLLAAKRYRLRRSGVCINNGLCGRCKVFETCRLPLALSAKKAQKE